MDAVWMIDFATSCDMPLCNDLAKLEVALLFEYTILPVTPDMLLFFAGGPESTEADWRKLNVRDWLGGVPEEVMFNLLKELQKRYQEVTASWAE